MTSISVHLTEIQNRLSPVSSTAALDSQVLLAHVLGINRARVIAHPEQHLTVDQEERLSILLRRLESGEPLPYVLGRWEFYGLDFVVTPQVLIPRPETELLVERALDWLQTNPARRWALDVGAGSGCIAVALTVNIPDLKVVACDLSIEALAVARSNILTHNVAERVHLLQTDLLAPFPNSVSSPSSKAFDLICANLPYISTETLKSLRVSGFEPGAALQGGEDGLSLIRRLLDTAPPRLAPGGLMLLEIEASQGSEVHTLAQVNFPGALVEVLPDLAGHDRLLVVEKR